MLKASEMTIDQIENVLDNVDWTETHKLRVFSDYGASVVIYTDGSLSVQDQGTYYPSPDDAGVLGYLRCWGRGNVDRTTYFEGWAEWVADSNHVTWNDEQAIYTVRGVEVNEDDLVEIDTGRVLTQDEALNEAIEEGYWDYDEERDELLRSIMEQRDQQAVIRGEE
jgi:hypothetical protein